MSKKETKKSPEMIKEELLPSLLENIDENELGINTVMRANQPNEAIRIIKKYKLLLKGENKKMVGMVGKQGDNYLKYFKESNEFFSHAGLDRRNIYFKTRLCKFLTKFIVLKNSSLSSVTRYTFSVLSAIAMFIHEKVFRRVYSLLFCRF